MLSHLLKRYMVDIKIQNGISKFLQNIALIFLSKIIIKIKIYNQFFIKNVFLIKYFGQCLVKIGKYGCGF